MDCAELVQIYIEDWLGWYLLFGDFSYSGKQHRNKKVDKMNIQDLG